MELFGMSILMIALFAGFGLLVGILFGFFGMGGSFLVTPALLVLGYPATVAVGSGLAFVFGTSVNSTLRHRAFGHVDHRLAGLLVVGMVAGIWAGKQLLLRFARLGSADLVISALYAGLLGAVGLFMLRESRTADTRAGIGGIATVVQAIEIPPMTSLNGGGSVSMWVILAVGFGVGGLSGLLGVGGGFLLMPVLTYGFGIPAAVAVGTDVLQITLSSAFGTFIYAQSNAVDVPVVAALLAGSALGARIGARGTSLVDEADIKGYFAVMLLAGGVAVASKHLSTVYDIEVLDTVSAVLIFGAAALVGGAVVRASVVGLREERRQAQGGETSGSGRRERDDGPPLTH